MAEDDQRPLLTFEEEDEYEIQRQKVRNLCSEHGSTSPIKDVINISGSTSVSPTTEFDNIVAIFVVAFDTRSGNVIEWCMPEDIDLDGVEFKAMASGSHTLSKDFVYFKKDGVFGLACFENMKVESEIERGARMKSVGILSTSYTSLYRHMLFLETQVRHQLEIPGNYVPLKAFYEDKKGMLPMNGTADSLTIPSVASTPSTPSHELLPEMKITHPAGCFNQFIKFFSTHIFTLWKFALLQKRILFFSPPPIGVVCYRVYCACCLGNHNIQGLTSFDLRPHFYVNVADIESLESEIAYIACTTEKIFECKTHLFDVYVDNQIIHAHSPALCGLIKLSNADHEKFARLNNQRSAHLFSMEELGYSQQAIDEEEFFTNFFTELNDRLFQTLLDISCSQDRQLTSDHMKSMGLDPIGDRSFLMELVEHYGIDVVLMVDNPCCPK
ncbi:DENN domain-containing protein 11-like [Gigantopelta aegis]|uniref:DENN domain-containing protein 11-like n=1 Tax=Gigantopelta aegis TaxID=1735272 RepID=UPI001B88D3EC|nr:DENN domain-containing protein 11-like [Gigantopelta aegis]